MGAGDADQIKKNKEELGRLTKELHEGVRGTANTADCLLETAKKIALSHKWSADPNAPTKQIGFVTVNFKLN